MDLLVKPDGTAEWGARRFRCALGRGGVRRDKREGDGATPAAAMALERVLYRPDRVAPPDTALARAALRPDDGWCDAPDDAHYNRQVRLPHGASAEAMWRDDGLYDLIAVTDYNAAPVTPGRGSAIFVHVAGPGYAPTEGCVAFTLDDLRQILAEWREDDRIRVEAA